MRQLLNSSENFSEKVLSWFEKHGRHHLPWQEDPTPYRVWISEVMLQQTQVSTVIGYFTQFMQQFPTIEHLAKAPLDLVLSLWSGLGYYTRARNLHQCAKLICKQYHAEFPMDVSLLEKLPGIGRSTAGAIISLSHNHFAPILDGNVRRVLARFFVIDTWTGETKTQKKLWEKAELLTSKARAKDYNQAMMDLGATICTRTKPRCSDCPLNAECKAFLQNKTNEYPIKKPKAVAPTIHKQFLLILSKHSKETFVWLYKRPPTGIWGGLWSLPELEMNENPIPWVEGKGLSCIQSQPLPPIKHIFSHFLLYLHPIQLWVTSEKNQVTEQQDAGWHSLKAPWPGGISAPIMKLIKNSLN